MDLNERNKYVPYRKTNDENIGDVIKKMITAYGLKDQYMEVSVRAIWKRMMGGTIAKNTKKITLRNGKLFIQITIASLRQELGFAKEKIKIMINTELKEDLVQEVIIW